MRKRSFYILRFIVSATLTLLLSGLASFAQRIPTPEEFLGYKVGADYHLTSYQKAIEYLRALEKSSSMIKLFEMGKTSMGKPMIYAVITSAENMANLNRFKEISRKLARAKGLTDEEARSLAAEGKAVVYIDGGLHATEVAPAEKNIQLAYELLTSEDPGIRLILDSTILLNVFANPDGMDMVVEWYHQNVGTPFEVSPMPWLYNKYVGHDNNRDAFMTNMVEQQNFARLLNHEWYPAVIYNPHQRGPFPTRIWIPPNAEATHSDVHPLILRWQNLIGCAMGLAFDQEGKPGAISRINYDNWQPGGYAHVGLSHNIPSLLSETNLYRYATPRFYTLDDFPEEYKDFTISAFYPNPWRGGWWRLKDAVDYTLTAAKAVLHTAAIYREKLLYDKYQMGRDVIARFQKEPPYAWIIPQDQWWTRWLFEQFEFPFTNIHDAEMKGSELKKLFDVLVIPAMDTNAIVNGHKEGIIPPQYVGGITNAGVENIKRFVKEGGTLVTLNSGCLFALDKLGLPIDNALKDAKPPEFACPGSILRMEFNPKHPVAYGMPEEAQAVLTRRSPAFNIIPSLGKEKVPVVIAKYPKGNLLRSGYLRGEKYLQHKASAMEAPFGKGKVILLGFGVQNRAQPHGTFKLLFNSLYYSSVE